MCGIKPVCHLQFTLCTIKFEYVIIDLSRYVIIDLSKL